MLTRTIAVLSLAAMHQLGLAKTSGDPFNPFLGADLKHRLAAFNGVLLGFDGGEWVGGLLFLDASGQPHELLHENVQAIIKTSKGVFVFTGLGHLSLLNGAVYKLVASSGQEPRAQLIRQLPGFPLSIRRRQDGTHPFLVLISNERPDGRKYECFRLAGEAVVQSSNCSRPPQ